MSARFEIVETAGGHAMGEPFHTRMIAANGEPISRSGDQYVNLADARRAIEVEAEMFGYDVVQWQDNGLLLAHRMSHVHHVLPVVRVDERAQS